MTESEAKFEIIEHIPIIGFSKYVKALNIAIEALEKQIPKKPTIYTRDNETEDKDRLACCSVCDSNVDWTYEGYWRKGNPKYCSKCGQKLDWSK